MSSPNHVLKSFIADVTYKMQADYARIRATTKADPTTAGDEGENGWAKLLKDWLPAHYHVGTKGHIVSADGRFSGQMDVVVLKPSYPSGMLDEKKWLADGVAAAFQCKNTLRAADLEEAFRQSKEVKSLVMPRFGTPYRELKSPIVYGLLSHSHSWKGKNSTPVQNIDNAIAGQLLACQHPKDILDFLCVSDLASWRYDYLVKGLTAVPGDHSLHAVLSILAPEGYVVPAGMTCISSDNTETFQPIGAFLSALLSRLAREDGGLESISRYFRSTGIAGLGSGGFPTWQPSIAYSPEVVAALHNRPPPQFVDEWTDSALL